MFELIINRQVQAQLQLIIASLPTNFKKKAVLTMFL